MLEAFLKFVAATALGGALTFLWNAFRRVFPRKLAWRISVPAQTYFSVATTIDRVSSVTPTTGEETHSTAMAATRIGAAPYGTYIGEVRALGIILPDFCRAYGVFDSKKVLFSEELPATFYDCDIICLGGPVWNRTTRYFLDRLKGVLPIEIGDHEVQYQSNPSSKQIIFRPTYEGKLVKRDVGVIIKCTNPENSTRGCLMLFGMRTYGVEAAAKAFVSKLTGLTRVWPKRYFCVVESDVLNHAVGDPRVLVYKTF